MQYLSSYFKPLHAPHGTTLSFLNTRLIPHELLDPQCVANLSQEQSLALLNQAIKPLDGSYRLSVILSKAYLLFLYKDYEQAFSLIKEVDSNPNIEPWVQDQIQRLLRHINIKLHGKNDSETCCKKTGTSSW